QLHQHAVADPRLPFPDADAGDDAWRVGGVQSLAGADGLHRRADAEALRYRCRQSRDAGSGGACGAECDPACLRRRPGRSGADVAEADRPQGLGEVMLERRAAMATLLANRPKNLFVVPGLGSCTWDAFAAGDDDRNFYLWGAMGGAAMIGLGLALAKPDLRVAVITGDGEMLMGLGSLATIGVQKPANLTVVVFDNGLYGETGMRASHTHGGV